MLTPRQQSILSMVVRAYSETGQPVGSKRLAEDPVLGCGPSTIRNELAMLEEHGLLAHPHTSAGRVPTDAGLRWHVDHLAPVDLAPQLELELVRREVDEAMRITSETLSQVTNLLAIVSAPPIDTSTIKHIEVLLLQPQVVAMVVISSTGGVTKKLFTFESAVDPGLAAWAAAYLNERLAGTGLGARMLMSRMFDPSLGATERAFLNAVAPVFTDLEDSAQDSLYVDGTARLLAEHRWQDLNQINELMAVLERRAALLTMLRAALGASDVVVRIGSENELPALRSLALVAAGYGLPQRQLGTVSVLGPVNMDYASAIQTVRGAANHLSRYVQDIYES